ncbi:MAG: AraC-type DNA-binding protein [Rhizobacter sp.]|nr:AraC-type DNA-binding protein [Rhizobacter sp.]
MNTSTTKPQRNATETTLSKAPQQGAELLRGRFVDFAYDVHTHATACFALLTWGSIRIRMRGTEFIAKRGDLYAIDADEPHAGWPVDAQGWSLRTIYVDLAYLHSLVSDGPVSRSIRLGEPIIRDPELSSTFYGVHRCSQEQGSALLREERYLAFVTRLFERHAPQASAAAAATLHKEDRAVRLAQEFLDHRLDERVHLGEIAHVAGLPTHRLFRAFSRVVGMTPDAYQRQARIRLAIDLIRRGDRLSEVAAATGFADQAHLTRSFRRAMGVTPGIYQVAMSA